MRLLTIGIDGGTFKTLVPMINLGTMPNLKKAMVKGSYAIAESVIPTNSAAAWSSIMTGLNPGKHGVFYFNDLERTESGPKWGRIINFSSIHGITAWKLLSDYGFRVCVVNVPITYPPEEVNGVLVSGLLAPSESSNYTYPSILKKELTNYKIDINLMDEERPSQEDWYNHIIREVIEITKLRNQNMVSLLKRERWDLVMVVYRETDDVQHFLWHIISQGFKDPDHTPYFPKVKEYFSVLDSSIAELIQQMGEDSNTIIISDHGFDAMPSRVLDLDSWARSRGLQFFQSDYAEMRIALVDMIRKMIANEQFGKIVDIISQHRKLSNSLEFGVVKKKDNLIDWSKTVAFKFGDGLAIKEDGVDDSKLQSMKQAIWKNLTSLKDPKGSSTPVADVIPREQIYSGEFSSLAPDLIVLPSAGYKISTIPGIKIFEKSPKTELTGEHDREGIFIAFGPNIKQSGQIEKISILDFFPTILEMYGIEPPVTADGKALRSILIGVGEGKIAPLAGFLLQQKSKQIVEFSNSEEEELRERLSRLGYL